MNVLVFPRSPNPYQDELYGSMQATAPLAVRYLGELTPSQTVNVLLLPLEIAFARARGARVLHLHWVYPFGLVWARPRWARRLLRMWFGAFLLAATACGIRVVWTAHNLVPHELVFDDDIAARRMLIRRCHTVIAHSDAVAAEVRRLGARDVVVIPPGLDAPTTSIDRTTACADMGLDPDRYRVLHFGVIRDYKGVDTLLATASALATDPRCASVDLLVVGACPDPVLRRRLTAMAAAVVQRGRVHVRFEHVADAELDGYLAASDVAAFPFRDVTSSSSVGRALAAGVPVIVPALATLADVPEPAALRYDPADPVAGLAEAIGCAAALRRERLDAMAGAARRTAADRTWPQAAASTWHVIRRLDATTTSHEPAGALQ
jgi:glycosyltransferase involved in cell wall biosynthesis